MKIIITFHVTGKLPLPKGGISVCFKVTIYLQLTQSPFTFNLLHCLLIQLKIWRKVITAYSRTGLTSHSANLQSSHAKSISTRSQKLFRWISFNIYKELFINFSTTWMFLVYPILPHFLGHNFLSLNPSISDKRNIQTLAEDSDRNILMWSPPILHILSNWNIPIWCRVVPAWITEYCWVMMFLSECLLVECFAITNSLYLC